MGLIDVHVHLQMLEMSPADALEKARQAGIDRVITIGTRPDDWPIVKSLVAQFEGQVFGTLGVHPHDADQWTPELARDIEEAAGHPNIIGVGEIGLDYYYKNSAPEVQLGAFREQMAVAARLNLPVEIHTREAEEDTWQVLNEYAGRVRGLLHCFTSSWSLAERALGLGYNISISGVVTFKNADALRQVVQNTPLDRLHVETDAPFLAPVPYRGQKNHPALMLETAKKVAELKGVSLSELAAVTSRNAEQLFPKLKARAVARGPQSV